MHVIDPHKPSTRNPPSVGFIRCDEPLQADIVLEGAWLRNPGLQRRPPVAK
jgi:hypothetical protein